MSKNRIEAFTDAVIAIVMTFAGLRTSPTKNDTLSSVSRHRTSVYHLFDQFCDAGHLLEQSSSSLLSCRTY